MDGKPLTRIEVHGKNLFYFFGEGEGLVVMHVHFGMSGAFKTLSLPGPEPRETTRLILTNKSMGLTLHLSAMTVAHGGVGTLLLTPSVCTSAGKGCRTFICQVMRLHSSK